MPTGYTADVQSGKVTDFRKFALTCARAFGATILMRDDPLDAPIPQKFEASDYHVKELAAARSELARLKSMKPSDVVQAAASDYASEMNDWNKRQAERAKERLRYETMLEKAKAWVPPSPEHDGLKRFMVDQLTESIDFDCGPGLSRPVEKAPAEWLREKITEAEQSIAYHTKHHAEEVQRADGRTRWVQQLRQSLGEQP
jgi:hypothetical protein